jgi:hypothetical protein
VPHKRKTPDRANSQTIDSLDRWDSEGGAAARLGSEALITRIETLPNSERQILQCLGAAVVIEWNELPTGVKRTLFKLASAENGADSANELPAQIARFLHEHKDDLRD